MLPTPSTSHVSFDTVYEPAEDSYLFLDTLSSPSESSWLSSRFSKTTESQSTSPPPKSSSAPPLIVEVGTGSGVVLAFVAANSQKIFGRRDVLALGTDVNGDACTATRRTVVKAIQERQEAPQEILEARERTEEPLLSSTSSTVFSALNSRGRSSAAQGGRKESNSIYLASLEADLCRPLRLGSVDVLLFNPPYVPTPDVPPLPLPKVVEESAAARTSVAVSPCARFDEESYLLSLSYAGGTDGMETTNRLLTMIPSVLNPDRGVAYVLLCAQNRPEQVKEKIRSWGSGWVVETVGSSGMHAGWEKLAIIRIWREQSAS